MVSTLKMGRGHCFHQYVMLKVSVGVSGLVSLSAFFPWASEAIVSFDWAIYLGVRQTQLRRNTSTFHKLLSLFTGSCYKVNVKFHVCSCPFSGSCLMC